MNVPILMYHRVVEHERDRTSEFVVTKQTFAEHLAWLHEHHYWTPDLEDVVAGNIEERSGEKPVLLTFDDGYLDNLTVALPLLLERGFTATIFALADFRRNACWWDAVPAPLLSPSQIREMARLGLRFGSHGVGHRRMTTLRPAELARELVVSRRALEDLLGESVTHFAYPYGAVDERVKGAVADAGYTAAFAVHSGPLGVHDPFEIRRVHIGESSSDPYLLAKLSGLDSFVRWGKWALSERARVAAPL